jgi:hypothetical protein
MRLVLVVALAACAGREPVRFGSPMLGMASVPPPPLPGERLRPEPPSNRDPMPREDKPRASAAAAAAIAKDVGALPAPHKMQSAAPRPRTPIDLHDLVGRREKGEAFAVTLGWARGLGVQAEASTGAELVAWADRAHKLHGAGELPEPGDLLVFDRTQGDDTSDLIAIVVGRDARNVIEMIYVAGGVVRRGFVDAARPAMRRDKDGAVVNTYLRHGKRSPPSGTHYLAGELLAHVVRAQ